MEEEVEGRRIGGGIGDERREKKKERKRWEEG